MRTLHVIDLENLLGDRTQHIHGDIVATLRKCLDVGVWASGDAIVIAANWLLARRAVFDIAVPHRFLVSSCDQDAADERLLEYVAGGWVQRRFPRVVVGSGDHAFAPFVTSCLDAGIETVVVANEMAVSWRVCQPGVLLHTLARSHRKPVLAA